MIELSQVSRCYGKGENKLTVLNEINLTIADKEFLAITGPSGSGKSTLLGLLAGLDRPSSGQIIIDKQDITQMSEKKLSSLRAQNIGFVFQSFHLIQTLTALENVRIPLELLGIQANTYSPEDLLTKFGLESRMHHYPSQLSGGEMQRVAIARAAITSPPIIMADEPTGNLDSHNGAIIMDILSQLNHHSTLILVTHNPDLAKLAHREVRLIDGRIDSIVNPKGARGMANPNKHDKGKKPSLKVSTANASVSSEANKIQTAKKKTATQKIKPRPKENETKNETKNKTENKTLRRDKK